METLTSRVKGILFEPRATLKEAESEFTKGGELWVKYIIPLAAIGPIAGAVGRFIFGKRIASTTLSDPVSITNALTWGLIAFALALLSVFVLSQIISMLAPGFGGQKNDVQALKMAAYASTPVWLGGIFTLHARFIIVSVIIALYGLYLLYVGLPILMKVPQDRSMGYTAVVIIAAIVIFLLVSAFTTF
jgi:hypothetical protein